MKYLPKILEWDTYTEPVYNKGILFEYLVKDIIKYEYPNQSFYFTPITGDEGHDLEGIFSMPFNTNASTWVECKNLKDKLSLSDISNTFVFAYIKSPSILMIFSYSELNENLKEELATFSAKSNIKIEYIADEELENKILKHIHQINLKYYYPKFNFSNIPVNADLTEKKSIIHGIVTSDPASIKDITDYKIKYSELFYLKIFVENRLNFTREFKLKIPEEYKKLFHIENKLLNKNLSAQISVNPYSTGYFIVPLRLNSSKNEISLPPISIEYINEKNNPVKNYAFKDKKLKVLFTTESILVGENYLKIIDAVENNLNDTTLKIVCLHGSSGVGKSRMLKELSFVGERNGYLLFSMNFEAGYTRLKDFCKNAIKTYEGFPYLTKKATLNNIDMPLRKRCALEIYNEEFDYKLGIEYIADYFCELFVDKKCLFLLDNIQNADKDLLNLFNAIINRINGINIKSTLILSFNDDLLNDEASILEERIIELSGQEDNSYYVYNLSGFRKNDEIDEVYIYLKNIFINKNDNNDFNAVIKLISDKCGTNPYYLNAIIKSLYENGVLERNGLKYEILDYDRFSREAANLPVRFKKILSVKCSNFRKNLSKYEDATFLELIKVLNIIHELPIKLYNRLFNADLLLDKLIQAEFVSCDGDFIMYHHHLLCDYLKQLYRADDFLLHKIVNNIESLSLTSDLIAPYFIVKDFLNVADISLCKEAMAVSMNDIDIIYLKDYSMSLATRLLQYHNKFDCAKLLNKLFSILTVVKKELGMNIAISFVEKIYKVIKSSYSYYLKSWKQLNDLMYNIICTYLDVADYNNVFIKCNEYENACEDSDISNESKFYASNMVSERRFQVYLKIQKFDEAEKEILKAYCFAKKVGSHPKELKALFAKGKLKFYLNDIEGGVAEWKGAYDYYNKLIAPEFDYFNFTHRDCLIIANIDGLIADLISGSEDYQSKINVIKSWLSKSEMPYHEIKMRLALAAADLYKSDKTDPNYIEEAKYLCIIHNYKDMYPRCFCMAAALNLKENDYKSALENIHMSIKAFLKIRSDKVNVRQPCIGNYLEKCISVGGLVISEELRRDILKTDLKDLLSAIENGEVIESKTHYFFKEIPRI